MNIKKEMTHDFIRKSKNSNLIYIAAILKIDYALSKDPYLTPSGIKQTLNLNSSKRTIRNQIRQLGWRKIQLKYCKITSPSNRLKNFIYSGKF